MVRLRHEDLEDPPSLALLAAVVGQTPERFRAEFADIAV